MKGLLLVISMGLMGQDVEAWVRSVGGFVGRGGDGAIVEVSLARTWVGDNDLRRVMAVPGLKKLDLSFTYVTDKGMEMVPQLAELEELTLDTAEFITDAALSHLRGNRKLRKLVLRGTDITDVGMPYIGQLTGLRSLDLSHSMLGDVGIESLAPLTELEELDLGGTRITGIHFSLLKLLPKLKKLSFKGIQRRNGGACWTPTIVDRDLDTLALLTELEELNLGAGLGLGVQAPGAGRAETNCRLTGGIRITDVGVRKLGKMRRLRALELSGAAITAEGVAALRALPQLERLSLWHCRGLDDGAWAQVAGMARLRVLDASDTGIGDEALGKLGGLERVYLTDTRVSEAGANAFRLARAGRFVSWARRPGGGE